MTKKNPLNYCELCKEYIKESRAIHFTFEHKEDLEELLK